MPILLGRRSRGKAECVAYAAGHRYHDAACSVTDYGTPGRVMLMTDPLDAMNGEVVVLDTGSPIIYVGLLVEVSEHTFVLEAADMHDCRDGHAKKEAYLAEVRNDGVTVNRKRVVVMRSAIISASRLVDVVDE